MEYINTVLKRELFVPFVNGYNVEPYDFLRMVFRKHKFYFSAIYITISESVINVNKWV